MKLTTCPVRAWVNQPSTSQPYHEFHGVRVLALMVRKRPEVFFIDGPVIGMEIDPVALSEGWPKPERKWVVE